MGLSGVRSSPAQGSEERHQAFALGFDACGTFAGAGGDFHADHGAQEVVHGVGVYPGVVIFNNALHAAFGRLRQLPEYLTRVASHI